VKIAIRLRHRFAHRRIRGKVNYGLDAELLERSANQRAVRDLAFDQRAPSHRPAMACAQVVQNNRLITRLGQRFCRVAADVSGPTRQQN
jgi:hypothetical protein